jgi:hypothetical protein
MAGSAGKSARSRVTRKGQAGSGTRATFEVNFLPEYKILHDAGYNILTYDLRNHGRSGMGSGGIIGHGVLSTAT